MWTWHRNGYLKTADKKKEFLETDDAKALCFMYPKDFVMAALQLALECLDHPEAEGSYSIINDEIAYPEIDGAYTSCTVHSYKTLWTACREKDVGRIKNVPYNLHLACGSLDYAEIPKYSYTWIGGVTATLELSPLEQAALQRYNVVSSTIMPTIFVHKKQVFDPSVNVQVVECGSAWFAAIHQEIQRAASSPRPVLVYFATQEELDAFLGQAPDLVKDPNLLVLREGSDIPPQVELPPPTKLLAVGAFGRGVDFICPDAGVEERGGVHVVQTFYSTATEQKQIQGRTARQAKSGTFELIVNGEQLLDGENLRVAMADKSHAFAILAAKRETDARELQVEREEDLAEAARRHHETMLFLANYHASCKIPTDKGSHDAALSFIVGLLREMREKLEREKLQT
jgi:hypothetical protein